MENTKNVNNKEKQNNKNFIKFTTLSVLYLYGVSMAGESIHDCKNKVVDFLSSNRLDITAKREKIVYFFYQKRNITIYKEKQSKCYKNIK